MCELPAENELDMEIDFEEIALYVRKSKNNRLVVVTGLLGSMVGHG